MKQSGRDHLQQKPRSLKSDLLFSQQKSSNKSPPKKQDPNQSPANKEVIDSAELSEIAGPHSQHNPNDESINAFIKEN